MLKRFRQILRLRFVLIPAVIVVPFMCYEDPGNDTDTIKAVRKTGDQEQLELLSLRAKEYSSNKSIEEAKRTIKKGLTLAREKNLVIPYTMHWAEAEVSFLQGNHPGAVTETEKALEILKNTDIHNDYILVANLRANSLLYMGKFNDAIEAYKENVRFIQDKKLTALLPLTYREIATAYNIAGKPEEERKWTNMMLRASVEANDQDNLARAYFRLGEITYRVDSNFSLSNEYYRESLKIREQRGDTSLFPVILNKISWNYYKLGQLDTALASYNRMAEISEKQKSYTYLANALANMGTIYRDKKDNNKALFYYGKSTAYSLLSKDWFTLSWMNKDMSDMYRDAGDYKKAFECYVAYKNFNDSLSQSKYNMGLAEARVKFEADTRAKDLEVLILKLQNQRYLLTALGGGILLVLVTGFLLFRQSKISAKRRISEMNQKIAEITQANLRQQMNPHFIFNTLNSIQYYMYQHDKIATNNYLTKFSMLMRKTLENSQHTTVSVKDELDALELYLELETIRFKEKFEYAIQVDEEIDPLLYKIPTMLMQPYVENAISHGLMHKEGKGLLKIGLALRPDHITCTVEDNGIGREAAMEIRKNRENNHHSLGTRITETRLQLVNELHGTNMKIHYTDLKDEQGRPAGTRVEIEIPILT
jgi:tetratricopeptide (TPR) repeat protein